MPCLCVSDNELVNFRPRNLLIKGCKPVQVPKNAQRKALPKCDIVDTTFHASSATRHNMCKQAVLPTTWGRNRAGARDLGADDTNGLFTWAIGIWLLLPLSSPLDTETKMHTPLRPGEAY